MNEIINEAKAEFIRAKERITRGLTNTPDNRINWSPAPSARTPVQLVAHAAMGTAGIRNMIAGEPFPFANMNEMDAASRMEEKKFTTREAALKLLEETSTSFLSWLETLTDAQLNSVANFPMMEVPMKIAITIPADHLRSHASQLDYVQTIYGDHEFHM